ncbi:MAG: ribonuclease H-like domain-containing protein [Candidatus Methanoperedens sp.]|nr:ribonuclease H-like domain-containing protein [Candidatus Methanoperedens sp.]MCZ7370940.1 ribonuclease H-like domain-containing protein [Candidatus Methanoperedens sp.]
MLKNTYIHLPGIGSSTERKIWKAGIENWEDFLDNLNLIKVPKTKKRVLLSGIEESIEQLTCENHIFFSRRLEVRDQWRAYRHFKNVTAYVDIETTGLSPEFSRITMIGIYNGKETKTFIRGINLEGAQDELRKYKQLVTFNGARFDLPFIQREFPGFFNHLHVDLMYPLKKIGYSGGLKKIETSLGIARSEETCGIMGFDAVRLWNMYQRGKEEALDILVKYNAEDVVNLEKIIEMTYHRMIEKEMDHKMK